MSQLKYKMRYISNRIIVMGLAIGLFVLVMIVGIASLAISEEEYLWYLVSIIAVAILLLILSYFYIIRPYKQWEKLMHRFLDGYLPFDMVHKHAALLTPYTYQEISKVNEILNSTQVVNLNKRQAQYLALQNQINPHFLYNTLEGIRSEALFAGVENVADMTEALATFFRYTISKVENLVTVEEELSNCKTYFKIQQYRFGDRLQLHIECNEDDWDEILRCKIPKLTFQPVLENSIIHGTELKIGTGNLTIYLERTDTRLFIRISDDGVGMDEDTLSALNKKLGRNGDQLTALKQESEGGIALINVNNRIHLIFGEEYGMHVFSMEGVGTDVEITIPIITSDREIKGQGVMQ